MEIKKMESTVNSILSEGPNKNLPEFLSSLKMKSKTKPLIYFVEIQCFECVVCSWPVLKWEKKVFG
jgi:hypothetical protein